MGRGDVLVQQAQGRGARCAREVELGELAFGEGLASLISCFATLLRRDKSLAVATDAPFASALYGGELTDIVGVHIIFVLSVVFCVLRVLCHPERIEGSLAGTLLFFVRLCRDDTIAELVFLYKITKNPRDYQQIRDLFSMFSKILMGIKEILRRECGGDEVRSMGVDAQLQSQSDEAAVGLALWRALLLEGVEVVRHAQPEHAALVLAAVGEVEEVIV